MQDLTALEREEAARKAAQEKADLEKWEAQKEAIAEKYRKEVLESPEMKEDFDKELKALVQHNTGVYSAKYTGPTEHPDWVVDPRGINKPLQAKIDKMAKHNSELEINQKKDELVEKHLEEQKEKSLAKEEADREQDRKQQLERLTPQKSLHNQPPRDLSALRQTENLVQAEQDLQAYKQVRDNRNPRDYSELNQGNRIDENSQLEATVKQNAQQTRQERLDEMTRRNEKAAEEREDQSDDWEPSR